MKHLPNSLQHLPTERSPNGHLAPVFAAGGPCALERHWAPGRQHLLPRGVVPTGTQRVPTWWLNGLNGSETKEKTG